MSARSDSRPTFPLNALKTSMDSPATAPPFTPPPATRIAFIGGGNMATAILSGIISSGHPTGQLLVVEPHAPQAALLRARFGIRVCAEGDPALSAMDVVVWAVKPQMFGTAAAPCSAFIGNALQLSIMAGVRSDVLARTTGSARVVRAMPNTASLVGKGIAGLFARPGVSSADRGTVEALLASTGETLWVDQEIDLDAVTAISGSGPAYVFYLLEAMQQAAIEMKLTAEQGRRLVEATFAGSIALAQASGERPETLRARVTSKGGVTQAAISALDAAGVKQSFVAALHTAQARAHALGGDLQATTPPDIG